MRLQFAKEYRHEPQKFWNKVVWTDETKINLDQSDEKDKVWRKKGSAHDSHTSSSVKHGGRSVMAWACMATSGVGSLICIDVVTHDGNSRILIGRNFIMQQDNDPKYIGNKTKDFIWEKKCKVLDWSSQSPDLNSIEHACHLL